MACADPLTARRRVGEEKRPAKFSVFLGKRGRGAKKAGWGMAYQSAEWRINWLDAAKGLGAGRIGPKLDFADFLQKRVFWGFIVDSQQLAGKGQRS